MCTLFANLYVLSTWGPHMIYHGDPIYISYLYGQMWLVGLPWPRRPALASTEQTKRGTRVVTLRVRERGGLRNVGHTTMASGSLMSLYGPTFHVSPVDLCIIFQCNLYISCIMSCGN